jgi:cholesterol transport system auxiliary component
MGDGSPMAHFEGLLQARPMRLSISPAAVVRMILPIAFLCLEQFRRIGRFAAVPVALALSACGGAPPPTFDLNSARDFGDVKTGRGALAIYEPAASQPLDSQRVVVRTGPDAIAYLKGAQWADRLPSLVQARLIESFENSHGLRAVGRPGLVAAYSLQSEIRRFEAEAPQGRARVEISVRIVAADGRVLTSKIFSAEVATAKDDPATVTTALDEALADVLRQIVLWTTPQVAKT